MKNVSLPIAYFSPGEYIMQYYAMSHIQHLVFQVIPNTMKKYLNISL